MGNNIVIYKYIKELKEEIKKELNEDIEMGKNKISSQNVLMEQN